MYVTHKTCPCPDGQFLNQRAPFSSLFLCDMATFFTAYIPVQKRQCKPWFCKRTWLHLFLFVGGIKNHTSVVLRSTFSVHFHLSLSLFCSSLSLFWQVRPVIIIIIYCDTSGVCMYVCPPHPPLYPLWYTVIHDVLCIYIHHTVLVTSSYVFQNGLNLNHIQQLRDANLNPVGSHDYKAVCHHHHTPPLHISPLFALLKMFRC